MERPRRAEAAPMDIGSGLRNERLGSRLNHENTLDHRSLQVFRLTRRHRLPEHLTYSQRTLIRSCQGRVASTIIGTHKSAARRALEFDPIYCNSTIWRWGAVRQSLGRTLPVSCWRQHEVRYEPCSG